MRIPPEISPVVLAGGLGTRLRPVVADRPKALVSVAGRPFLAWILEKFLTAGFQEALLCTGYKSDLIEAEFGTHFHSLRLRYSMEVSPLGTGGALRLGASLLSSEFALVVNGDSYLEADLSAFCLAHLERRAAASMLLVHVPDASRFGLVSCDASGRVGMFQEKTGTPEPGWINAGVYILPVAWLLEIPEGRPISLEREMFPGWLPRGIHGVRKNGRFVDIGTPESLLDGDAFLRRLGSALDSQDSNHKGVVW